MSYRQLLRRAFNGNAPIKQYELYTLAMSCVSMVIQPYKPVSWSVLGHMAKATVTPIQ